MLRRLKEELLRFVTAPVDKYPGELFIVCPCIWAAAVLSLAGKMRRRTPMEADAAFKNMLKAGEGLIHLPYTRLQRATKHRWGALRCWPKWKSVARMVGMMRALEEKGLAGVNEERFCQVRQLEEVADAMQWSADGFFIKGWDAVKWRPLVSYSAHHWRGLLRMLGQLFTALAKRLSRGNMMMHPRAVVERAHIFNRGARRRGALFPNTRRRRSLRRWGGRRQRPGAKAKAKGKAKAKAAAAARDAAAAEKQRVLGKKVLDVKEFFPGVPRQRFLHNLAYALDVLKREKPRAKWFSVERQEMISVDLSVPRGGLFQGGWRRLGASPASRQMFTEQRRRGWRSIFLEDTPEILDIAWNFGIVRVLKVHHVPEEGFTIGVTKAEEVLTCTPRLRNTGTGRRR